MVFETLEIGRRLRYRVNEGDQLLRGGSKMKIGVAIGKIDNATLEDDLRTWLSAGISAIECNYLPLMENSMRTLELWAKLFKGNGVMFWAVHAPFDGHHNLANPDGRLRRRAVEYHKFVIERTRAVDAKYLVIHPSGAMRSEEERKKAWSWLRESLEELLPVAEDANVALAVENMLPEAAIGYDAIELSDFVATFSSNHLRLCFDTGHAHIAGDVKSALEHVADMVGTYHIADNDKAHDLHLPPGYGCVPWDALMPILMQADFPLIVETCRWQDAPWGQLREEVEAVLSGRVVTVEVDGHKGVVRCIGCGRVMIRAEDGSVRCACP
jgi:sugar phosphate isomerase/epimerase